MRAADAGYGVVNPGGMSAKEREAFRKHADVKGSDEVFPTPPPPRKDYEPEPGSKQARFAEWVTEMAGHCNLRATVRYFDEPDNMRLADCSESTATPILRFNEARIDHTFFEPPYGTPEHWKLLLHELGHAVSNRSAVGYGEAWGEGISKAGALIVSNMLGDRAK